MKKLLCIILSIAMLTGLTIPVFAQNSYDIEIDAGRIFSFDENESSGGYIDVRVPELEKYGYVQIYVDFNTDILQFGGFILQPVAVYTEYCRATDTGMCFYVSWNDQYADRSNGWGYSTLGYITCIGVGEVNFSIRVEATDVDGNIIEPKVKITEPYGKVVNKSEINHIDPKESADVRQRKYIYFKGKITQSEALSYLNGNNIMFKDANGNTISDNNSFVTNGGTIYTAIEDYIIDTLTVCVVGDTNCDGDITAADARIALRAAANLDKPEWIVSEAADIDDNGKITASDARTILRIAAGLS
ncbi:MAG: dockerin type I repeat-containing protein [Clostridia bacterium]|nr:dockerin type I repeat-containing protein [Clostridia bacterium]